MIFQRGVEKLAEAQNLVTELRLDAEQQQNVLEEKQAKANASLNMISDTMKGANTQKEEMENLQFNIQEESIKLTERYFDGHSFSLLKSNITKFTEKKK